MAVITTFDQLKDASLQSGDEIRFPGISYSYYIHTKYMGCTAGNNYIFTVLSIEDKYDFCTKAFGYIADKGGFPEWKHGDYNAAKSVAIALWKLAETKTTQKHYYIKAQIVADLELSKQEWINRLSAITQRSIEAECNFIIHRPQPNDCYVVTGNTVDFHKSFTPKEYDTEITITQITNFKKTKYEGKFQRKKSDVGRGTIPAGSRICGKRSKTAIRIGHLSNRKVLGF